MFKCKYCKLRMKFFEWIRYRATCIFCERAKKLVEEELEKNKEKRREAMIEARKRYFMPDNIIPERTLPKLRKK